MRAPAPRLTGALRRLTAVALASAAIGLALPSGSAQAFGSSNGVRLNAVEARLVALINQARTSRGIPALVVTPGSTDLARKWAWQQAISRTMKHNPALVTGVERSGSPDWTRVAENVGYARTADSLFTAYMNSAGHRRNILDGNLRYLGMGWVERPDGWGYNTQVFVNQYTSAYGPSREPAHGGKDDVRRFTSTATIADFEAGTDPRGLTAGSGTGIGVTGVYTDRPGTGDQSARFGVFNRAGGTGGGAEMRLRDALDLTNVTALQLKLAARTNTGRPVVVDVYLRTSMGANVKVGSVTVPHGPDLTVTLPLPAAAKGFRNELALFVSRASLVGIDPWSNAGRGATIYVRSLTAVV